MMHLLRKYDVAPLRSAMRRCLPPNVAKPRIIREANIIRRSRHHLPKANIIQKNACAFFSYPCQGQKKAHLAMRSVPLLDFRFQRIFLGLPLTSKLDALCAGNANQLSCNARNCFESRATPARDRKKRILRCALSLAGVAGLEPTMRESKSLALPLGDTPLCYFMLACSAIISHQMVICQ